MQKTLSNINAVLEAFQTDQPRVREMSHGWKAAAARMRKNSLELEKHLKQFRKLSVAAANGEE